MISGGNPKLYVSNLARSIEFFTKQLGLKLKGAPSDRWAEIDAGGGLVLGLCLQTPRSPTPGMRGAITVDLVVDGPLDETVTRLENRGVCFRIPIVDDPGSPVRLAFFGDPDGNELCLTERKAALSVSPRSPTAAVNGSVH
jgi:catechol 2,3-dioxygenase-like lactoylglutathione lyase family enzyme